MPQQLDDLAMPPEQGDYERGPTVPASGQVPPRAGVEHQPGKVAVISVGGLVELRPAVVVAPVGVGAAVEQQRDDGLIASHPEEVVAIRPALDDEISEPVEEPGETVSIVILDRSVGTHERRRWFLAALHPVDVTAEGAPA